LYEPLHHKYRPQTFSQLVGQGAIAATLTHALEQNRIAPAYLFCGPRGTGKTSSARILAKSLNCLKVKAPTAAPCGECDVCTAVTRGSSLDIVEIDAASNTGVDNIRELIERSQFAPVQCRYKVYVIDECHMLSTAAFNALLKTLEEPPDRVVFVLATTDPQRVLPTIISRCQRFDFRRIPLPSMVEHLGYIAGEEAIAITPSATQLVAQISQGGLRDAESLLDQLSLQADEITVESVWDLVGAVPEKDLLSLVRAIAADDGTALLDRVRHLMDKGREPLIVLQSLVGFYRDLLIAKQAPSRADLVAITPPTWAEMTEFAQHISAPQLLASQQKLQTAEVQIKNTTQPRLWLEITLTGLLPSALGAIASVASTPSGHSANVSRPPVPSPVAALPITQKAATTAPSTAPSTTPSTTPSTATPTTPVPIAPPTAASAVSPPPSAPEPTTPFPQPVTDQSTQSTPPAPSSSAPSPDAPSASPATSPSETGSAPPTETTASESTTAAAPAPVHDVSFGSLTDLWNQVLAVLVPRGTQILMAQQGVLLGFDGVGAKVGFRSASLQKLAQSRVPNLEAAFQGVFQRPIRVSLEVVTAEESPVVEVAEPAPAPPAPPVTKAAQSGPSAQLPSDKSPHNPPSVAKKHTENGFSGNGTPNSSQNNSAPSNETPSSSAKGHNQSFKTQTPPPTYGTLSQNQSPPQNQGAPPSRLDAPADNIGFDQDQEKIKRFANFFNGQIVSLEGEDPGSSSPGASSPKSSDPGPDVPF